MPDKTKTYTYITQTGDKIEKPYKIKGVLDERKYSEKHPLITKVGGYLMSNVYWLI